MERQKLMTGDFEKDSSELKSALMIGESFDVVMRTVVSGFGQKCAFFYVTGFMNSVTVHDVIRHCVMQTIAPVTAKTVFLHVILLSDTVSLLSHLLPKKSIPLLADVVNKTRAF